MAFGITPGMETFTIPARPSWLTGGGTPWGNPGSPAVTMPLPTLPPGIDPNAIPDFDPFLGFKRPTGGMAGTLTQLLGQDKPGAPQLRWNPGNFQFWDPSGRRFSESGPPWSRKQPENEPRWELDTVDQPASFVRGLLGGTPLTSMLLFALGAGTGSPIGSSGGVGLSATASTAAETAAPAWGSFLTAGGSATGLGLSPALLAVLKNVVGPAALTQITTRRAAQPPVAATAVQASGGRTAGATAAASSRTRLTTASANLRTTLQRVRAAQARRGQRAGAF